MKMWERVCRVASEASRCYRYAKAQSMKVRAIKDVERHSKALGGIAQEQRKRSDAGSKDTTKSITR